MTFEEAWQFNGAVTDAGFEWGYEENPEDPAAGYLLLDNWKVLMVESVFHRLSEQSAIKKAKVAIEESRARRREAFAFVDWLES